MSDPEARRPVRLLGVPLVGGRAVIMFRDDMIRELQLIELGQDLANVGPSDLDPVAKALRSDLVWLRDEFSGHFRIAGPADLAGLADGDAATDGVDGDGEMEDYVADLHPDAATRLKKVVGNFEELNWFSSHGQLLTVGATPIVMELVRWLRDEASGQLIDGRPPRRYPRRTAPT